MFEVLKPAAYLRVDAPDDLLETIPIASLCNRAQPFAQLFHTFRTRHAYQSLVRGCPFVPIPEKVEVCSGLRDIHDASLFRVQCQPRPFHPLPDKAQRRVRLCRRRGGNRLDNDFLHKPAIGRIRLVQRGQSACACTVGVGRSCNERGRLDIARAGINRVGIA